MLCHDLILDYCIEPVNKVNRKLAEGYQLYGNAICLSDTLYQALVKTQALRFTTFQRLKPLQRACLEALMRDMSYGEIAKMVHRSVRTVEGIFVDLRQQFHCRTNVGLLLTCERLGLLSIAGPKVSSSSLRGST